MKLSLWFFLFSTLSISVFGQVDSWTPVIEDGFGIPIQKTAPEMEVFNDTLYVVTAPITGVVNAKLWRTGDDFATVEDVTPPLIFTDGDNSIHSFGKTTEGGGYFWLGTGHPSKGAMIFQSQNGKDWTPISKRGFGTPSLNGATPNMVVFQSTTDTIPYLYAGAGSHGGGIAAEVWRIPYNSTDSLDWVQLIDFDTVPTSISDTVDLTTYFEVWNDKVYFGTNGKGQLWESSDGVNFEQNMGVGYGFNDPTNGVISAMEIFNDTMYLTTTNIPNGGQLWRTGDGITFESITTNAFNQGPDVNELRKPVVFNGQLWLTGYTETTLSSGTPIWRSQDGTNWVQSNTNGFGDTLNNGQNPSLVGSGDFMYFGGPNYTAGAQIWRTDIATDIENIIETKCQIKLSPNPFSECSFINVDNSCTPLSRISIYDINGKLVKTIDATGKSIIEIDRDGLLKGMYFFNAYTIDKKKSSGKFILK